MAAAILLVGVVLFAGGVVTVAGQSRSPTRSEERALLITGAAVSVATAGVCAAVVGVLALILG